MRRLLTTLLSAFAVSALAATGDILQCLVRDDGWSVDVVFEGYTTNSTFTSGFATNNNPATAKGVLTVFSPGFDDTGTSNWTARTVYLTSLVRSNYPNQGITDGRHDATLAFVTNRISLSASIYAGDSVTAAITSGIYSNSAAFSGAVVNNSVQTWQKPIAGWSWPGWNRETGPNMRLRLVAFHSSAQQGRPVRCVKFIVSDEANVVVTNTVTRMSIGSDLPDLWPTGEYISDFALNLFGDHDQLRCDYIVYPWHGTNIVNTLLNEFTQPTPLPASITNFSDANNNYSGFVAVVGLTGSDTTGRATNAASPAAVDPAHYFLSIEQATQFIAASNNAFASPTTHNDVGGGVVYVKTGITNWLGGTVSAGGIPKCWVIVSNYPGEEVEFNTASGSADITDRVKIAGIHIGNGNLFNGIQHLWFDKCVFTNTATATIQSSPMVYMTYGWVTNIGQGLRSFGGAQNTSMALFRGMALDNYGGTYRPVICVGSQKNSTNGPNFNIGFDIAAQTGPNPPIILYNNKFHGFKNIGGSLLLAQAALPCSNGFAVVQNVFECDISTGQAFDFFGGYNTIQATNLIIWHNAFLGTKLNYMYNDAGSAAAWRRFPSLKNNIVEDYNLKTDTFTTADGARIGNWESLFGVGSSGNVFAETAGVGTPGNFVNNGTDNLGFIGLNTYQPAPSSTTSTNLIGFFDRKGYDGVNSPATGIGDYRIHSKHWRVVTTESLIRFDIEGRYRGNWDAPGPYATASPRKGDFIGL